MKLYQPNELPIHEDIKAAAQMGRLTFFIGNGVSRLYGIPSWDDLANLMLKKLAECGKLNHSLLEILARHPTKVKVSIADYYFKENEKSNEYQGINYTSLLMNGIDLVEIQKKIPVYKMIAGCNVKLITTNYDWLLSDALTNPSGSETAIIGSEVSKSNDATKSSIELIPKNKYKIYKTLKEFEVSSTIKNNFLVHIHGSLSDEKTLIASTASYLQLYNDAENQEKLRLLFKNQTVVFIGYSLEEMEILDLIIRSSKTRPNTEDSPRFFLVLSLLSHEIEILKYLQIYYKQLGVTIITYCRDVKGYHALTDVLEKWVAELHTIIQQPSAIDQFSLLDELRDKYTESNK